MKLKPETEKSIEEIVQNAGHEVVEIKYFSAGGRRTLRILADGETGITLDSCAAISRTVSEYLDEQDFGTTAYTLEVSSPGVDRPLTSEKDFRRVIGKEVRIRLRTYAKKSESRIKGILEDITENQITVKTARGSIQVELNNILSGKLEI
ncbi:MAG: ribosome maturation factor RimP [Fibrobacterota bacterium]